MLRTSQRSATVLWFALASLLALPVVGVAEEETQTMDALAVENGSLDVQEADQAATSEEEPSERSEAAATESCEKEPCDESACEEKSGEDEATGDEEAATAPQDTRIWPTHRQTEIVKVHVGDLPKSALKTFCLTDEGEILAACSDGSSGDVRRLSPSGEFLASWELPFAPEAINVGSDGRVYVAGEGRLARYTKEGELVNEGTHPRAEALKEQQEEIRKEVIEQHNQQLEWMKEHLGSIDAQIEAIDEWIEEAKEEAEADEDEEEEGGDEEHGDHDEEGDDHDADHDHDSDDGHDADEEEHEEGDDDDGEEEKEIDPMVAHLFRQLDTLPEGQRMTFAKSYRESFTSQKESYEQYLEQLGGEELSEEKIEEMIKSSIAYKMQVASISEADGEVFLATGASQGYGFSVWRMNRRFEGGEQIVDRLSGCCGQMDVQACDSGVYVAENSRKKVRCFDRTGERVCEWGSSGRSGLEGFGGCCNPMNVAFGPGGTVYTAESETGRIKRYSPSGELIELVGKADLVPGCKKVSIAIGPEGDNVYMLDITRNHIVMMERLGEGERADYYETRAADARTADGGGGGSWFGTIVRAVLGGE